MSYPEEAGGVGEQKSDLERCWELWGVGQPICNIYKVVQAQHIITLTVWNPFNYDTRRLAEVATNGIQNIFKIYPRFSVTGFKNEPTKIQIFVDEFGTGFPQALITPILIAMLAISAAAFLIVVWVKIEEIPLLIARERTQQVIVVAEQSKPLGRTLDELNVLLARGLITNAQYLAAVGKIIAQWPQGLPPEVRDSPATDWITTITTVIPAIIPLVILGAIISLVPRRGRD